MAIEVLEEALCIESVLSDKFSEFFDDTLHISALSRISIRSTISDICACSSNLSVNGFLKTLCGKDCINVIRELSPLNVVALLRCLIMNFELVQLSL